MMQGQDKELKQWKREN